MDFESAHKFLKELSLSPIFILSSKLSLLLLVRFEGFWLGLGGLWGNVLSV